jgi:exodeoxyribonuclease-1
MAASFFFYDLETSGFNPREARIMQFAGQRTDTELNPTGDPVNILIKLTPDTVPNPEAILVTGITPQQTIADGITEAEFLKFFYTEVVKPGTTFLGFNTVRFDDEFMRFLHYRNFYDAYEWQWCDDCSRWDILDLVRMTRALKPEGIHWPVTPEGKPTNRLELLTKANGLGHEHAHDALSDVHATIAVAKLIRDKQPGLFEHLFDCRGKAAIKKALAGGHAGNQVFTYVSGRYPSESLHATAVVVLAQDDRKGTALVYDLRHDPTPYLELGVEQLITLWQYNPDKNAPKLPVKTLKYNHCPAIIPGYPQDKATQERLQLTSETVTQHLANLNKHRQVFAENVLAAQHQLDIVREQKWQKSGESPVDSQLYDDFFRDEDKKIMRVIRAAEPDELSKQADTLKDKRLRGLLPLYKARNYSAQLTSEERQEWDTFCRARLLEGGNESVLAKYFARLSELANDKTLDESKRFLLEELQLYGESIMPVATDE